MMVIFIIKCCGTGSQVLCVPSVQLPVKHEVQAWSTGLNSIELDSTFLLKFNGDSIGPMEANIAV